MLPEQHNQNDTPAESPRRIIDGAERVFYDGYWIKVYVVPADTLKEAKKRLIDALTRRLFNHTEHGLNIPGTRLGEARLAFEPGKPIRPVAASREPCWRALCSTGQQIFS